MPLSQDERPLGELNYAEFAERYAQIARDKAHNAHYERPATLSLLPDVAGQRVLDAGCGPGFNTRWLLDHGAQVVAFDVTPDMVRITRQAAPDAESVYVHDLSQPLRFAQDASFDLIVCQLVLDYIEDWGPVFAEFARVLKPGGLAVMSHGHPQSDYDFWMRKDGDVDYFAVELREAIWHGFGEPAPVIRAYRRPLAAMLNPLVASGLLLDQVLEPKPVPSFADHDPERYERLLRKPGFIVIRARKPAAQ